MSAHYDGWAEWYVAAGFQLLPVEELGDGTIPWLFTFVAKKESR